MRLPLIAKHFSGHLSIFFQVTIPFIDLDQLRVFTSAINCCGPDEKERTSEKLNWSLPRTAIRAAASARAQAVGRGGSAQDAHPLT
ncbi:hypothetical protein ACFPFP_41960 [Bradyrhizobium sp. GCM10023182]|uniref:Uncharacterized protein n=1 Tax=Bradyrhizobium zhengyangense TaxID=2911009 RepID=A0ABS9M2A9_9BRAD|nr:hypothetical protein [Bradyrhizobium zhengyangense]